MAELNGGGELCLVTGATDGIGRAATLALLQAGKNVVAHGRNPEKLARLVDEASLAINNNSIEQRRLQTVQADFASLAEVASLAAGVVDRYGKLDVLVNNAGLLTDHRQLSADGFELTFAVNYLAPFLLTNLLMQLDAFQGRARIVNVASTAMGGGEIRFENLNAERSFDGWQAYANSKLANVLFSNRLAARLRESQSSASVVSNALCPGLIDTNFFHTNSVFANGAYERMQPGMRSPEEGAAIPVYLATAVEAAAWNGQFFMRRPGYFGDGKFRPMEISTDDELELRLWSSTARMVQPWLLDSKAWPV